MFFNICFSKKPKHSVKLYGMRSVTHERYGSKRIDLEIDQYIMRMKNHINHKLIILVDSWCLTIRSIKKGSPKGGLFAFCARDPSAPTDFKPPHA